MGTVNVRGLKMEARAEAFKKTLINRRIDSCHVQETGFDAATSAAHIRSLCQRNVVVQTRNRPTQGGGLLTMYNQTKMAVNFRQNQPIYNSFEYLSMTMTVGTSTAEVGNLYRPPHTTNCN